MFRLSRGKLLIILFACALALRLINLDIDVFGDESYYYYLARSPEQYALYHRDHPPLLYLTYHFFTEDISTFRVINIVVGSLIPCLIYTILSTYSIRERYRVLGASLPVFYTVFVRYSTVVFLDMLCAFFFLIAVYFYRRERWRLTDLFFGLSILTKEVAIFGVAAFIGYLIVKRRSIRFIFFPATIAAGVAVMFILISLGGWGNLWNGAAHGVFEEPFLFAIAPVFLPLLGVLIYRKYYVESLFFAVYPLVFLMYQVTADWYSVLPLSFNIVSIMVALNELHSLHLRKRTYIKYAFLGFFVSAIVFSSFNQAVATQYFIGYRPRQLRETTQFLAKNCKGRKAAVIDSFWGYSLYPFGAYLKVSDSTYTGYNFSVKYYSGVINQTGLAVIGTLREGEMNPKTRRALLQMYENHVVFRNANYTLIDLAYTRPLNRTLNP